MNILVGEGIIYKKRGIGVFVAQGALEKIKIKRQHEFLKKYIERLIAEANKLGLSKAELINLIERGFEDCGEN